MNARSEFLLQVGDLPILCSVIYLHGETHILTTGYTEEDFTIFLNSIDINYDDGYGSQELFGTIWYKDGTWSERHEYGGSECWMYKTYPIIPKNVMRIDKVREDKLNQIL